LSRQGRQPAPGHLAQAHNDLATAYGTVVIEDLAVKNMTACPKPKADPENPGHHLDNGHAAKAGLKGPSST
jgi:putative transposase